MEQEIWKSVVGYEGYYEVSNLGNVRSLSRVIKLFRGETVMNGKVLSKHLRNGYHAVVLTIDGVEKTMNVHRLVAEVFCEKHDGCDYIDHINSDRTDNRACNLEWVTQKENVHRAIRKGRCNFEGLKEGGKSVQKKILCIEKNMVFESMADANEYLGKHRYCSTLSSRLNSGVDFIWGFHWKYAA